MQQEFSLPGQKYSDMQNKEEKNCIKVLMYKHLVEDLQFVSHELIVYCKKKRGRKPSRHTQQIRESSVLPNYNPTDAVKNISEEDWRKKT